MPDLDTQLRRYVDHVLEQVPEIPVDKVVSEPVDSDSGGARGTRWALWAAAAAVVVAVAGVAVSVVADRGGEVTIGPGEDAGRAVDVERWGPPVGLVADGESVWVAMQGAADGMGPAGGPGGILRVDPTSSDQARIAQVASMHSVAVGAGSLWATGFTTDQVTRIGRDSGETLAVIDLPELPGFDDGAFLPGAIGASDQSVWVTTARGYAARIDPESNDVVGLYELVPDAPGSVAADGEDAWIAQAQEGITRQAASEDETGPTFPVSVDGQPTVVGDVLVDGDRRLWAAVRVLAREGTFSDSDSGAIVRFDMTTMRPALVASTPSPLTELTIQDGTVWGLARGGRLWSAEIDDTGQTTASAADFELGSTGADVTGDGQRLWMAVPDQRMLVRYEPASQRVRTAPLPGDPTSMQVGQTLRVGEARFTYDANRWDVVEIPENGALTCEQIPASPDQPTIYIGSEGFPSSCPAVENRRAPWVAFERAGGIYDPGQNRPCRQTTVGRLSGNVCYDGQGWEPQQFRTYELEQVRVFIRAWSGNDPGAVTELLESARTE